MADGGSGGALRQGSVCARAALRRGSGRCGAPSTLNPQPSTLNPQPSTLNPQPTFSLTPEPQPINRKPPTRRVGGCWRPEPTRQPAPDGREPGGVVGVGNTPPVLDCRLTPHVACCLLTLRAYHGMVLLRRCGAQSNGCARLLPPVLAHLPVVVLLHHVASPLSPLHFLHFWYCAGWVKHQESLQRRAS
jgi:hypothetical protein